MPLERNKALVRRFFEDAPYHPEVCDESWCGPVQAFISLAPKVTPDSVNSAI